MKRELDGVNFTVQRGTDYQYKKFKRSDVLYIYRVGWNPPSKRFGFTNNRWLYIDPITWTRLSYNQVIIQLKERYGT